MVKGMTFSRREQQRVGDLADALGASLDLHAVLADAYPLLVSLVGADYGALVAPRAERADQSEWIEHNLPSAFLGSYEEMAPHDFVLKSVLKKPRVVVRDSEMITRRALEQNMMYQRAREAGSPIEHVMAVMLHAGDDLRSGLSVYRDRRRPFSARDQQVLQQLTQMMANAVSNCCMHARLKQEKTRSKAIVSAAKVATIVVRHPAQELERTPRVAELLDAWFTPSERSAESLPRVLLEKLAQAQAERARGHVGPWLWKKATDAADLKVEFHPAPELLGEASWVLVFREVSRVLTMPASWIGRLTSAERKVTSSMLLGWDNELIAENLGCSPHTVKKHAQRIFKQLGAENRVTLLCRAMRDA